MAHDVVADVKQGAVYGYAFPPHMGAVQEERSGDPCTEHLDLVGRGAANEAQVAVNDGPGDPQARKRGALEAQLSQARTVAVDPFIKLAGFKAYRTTDISER